MQWLANLKIKHKLFLIINLLALLTIIITAFSIWNAYSNMRSFDNFYMRNMLPMSNLDVCRTELVRASYRSALHVQVSSEEKKKLDLEIEASDQSFDEAWAKYFANLSSDVERTNAPLYLEVVKEFRTARDKALAISRNGDNAKALEVLRKEAHPALTKSAKIQKVLAEDNLRQVEGAVKANHGTFKGSTTVSVILVVVGLAISFTIGILVVSTILRAVQGFQNTLGQVAAGDLRTKASIISRDELGKMGETLNGMVDQLRHLMQGVRQGVEGVASGATQLSASAEEMATTSNEIARSAETQRNGSEAMVAAVGELSASIEEVNRGAQSSLGRLEEAQEATLKGGPVRAGHP